MTDTITIDFSEIEPRDKYKIMIGTIVPRPIAWVTTVDAGGRPNAAPYSFFGCLSSDPPIIGLGIEYRADGRSKDTARNIRDVGVFTVNIVSHSLADAMNTTAFPFDEHVNEAEMAGLTLRTGIKVASPAIAESPAALECRLHSFIDLGKSREIILGEIVAARLRSDIVNERFHIDPIALDAVGRMGGSAYSTTRDCFDIKPPTL
ncbi:flavin reductase family protein [Agrobacterium sp. Ap1]|jgi:flavin reductase (DIM6/NTAB) family NADH-FMN oxidoreductase RutF|uniref:flavin reductase family protein n=1 Tax=Rhizobium/Agrobacterium group TaxID=227290 RepID=UPI000FB74842|nr:flavin reductase family protein [Agrobacterium sp. Ap1]MBO0142537.1 flavin reductase family protein [Agrobacterium sp. Ap1]